MKKPLKEIISGKGLGVLKFGMSREQVKEVLGQADEVEEYTPSEEESDVSEAWHYDELEISLGFNQEDDWRLITIAVSGPDYEFMNKKLIGLPQEELVQHLSEMGLDDLEFEEIETDDESEQIMISCDEVGVNFWIDDGFLSEIQWNPFYNDDDTIDWPE